MQGMMLAWTKVVAVEMARSDQVLNIFWKIQPTILLIGGTWGVGEMGESRMTPGLASTSRRMDKEDYGKSRCKKNSHFAFGEFRVETPVSLMVRKMRKIQERILGKHSYWSRKRTKNAWCLRSWVKKKKFSRREWSAVSNAAAGSNKIRREKVIVGFNTEEMLLTLTWIILVEWWGPKPAWKGFKRD